MYHSRMPPPGLNVMPPPGGGPPPPHRPEFPPHQSGFPPYPPPSPSFPFNPAGPPGPPPRFPSAPGQGPLHPPLQPGVSSPRHQQLQPRAPLSPHHQHPPQHPPQHQQPPSRQQHEQYHQQQSYGSVSQTEYGYEGEDDGWQGGPYTRSRDYDHGSKNQSFESSANFSQPGYGQQSYSEPSYKEQERNQPGFGTDGYNSYEKEDWKYERDGSGFNQNTSSFNQNTPNFNQNTSSFNQNTPNFNQNAPNFNQNAPNFNKNTSNFNQNTPNFNQNTPNFSQNAPNFNQTTSNFNPNTSSFHQNTSSMSFHGGRQSGGQVPPPRPSVPPSAASFPPRGPPPQESPVRPPPPHAGLSPGAAFPPSASSFGDQRSEKPWGLAPDARLPPGPFGNEPPAYRSAPPSTGDKRAEIEDLPRPRGILKNRGFSDQLQEMVHQLRHAEGQGPSGDKPPGFSRGSSSSLQEQRATSSPRQRPRAGEEDPWFGYRRGGPDPVERPGLAERMFGPRETDSHRQGDGTAPNDSQPLFGKRGRSEEDSFSPSKMPRLAKEPHLREEVDGSYSRSNVSAGGRQDPGFERSLVMRDRDRGSAVSERERDLAMQDQHGRPRMEDPDQSQALGGYARGQVLRDRIRNHVVQEHDFNPMTRERDGGPPVRGDHGSSSVLGDRGRGRSSYDKVEGSPRLRMQENNPASDAGIRRDLTVEIRQSARHYPDSRQSRNPERFEDTRIVRTRSPEHRPGPLEGRLGRRRSPSSFHREDHESRSPGLINISPESNLSSSRRDLPWRDSPGQQRGSSDLGQAGLSRDPRGSLDYSRTRSPDHHQHHHEQIRLGRDGAREDWWESSPSRSHRSHRSDLGNRGSSPGFGRVQKHIRDRHASPDGFHGRPGPRSHSPRYEDLHSHSPVMPDRGPRYPSHHSRSPPGRRSRSPRHAEHHRGSPGRSRTGSLHSFSPGYGRVHRRSPGSDHGRHARHPRSPAHYRGRDLDDSHDPHALSNLGRLRSHEQREGSHFSRSHHGSDRGSRHDSPRDRRRHSPPTRDSHRVHGRDDGPGPKREPRSDSKEPRGPRPDEKTPRDRPVTKEATEKPSPGTKAEMLEQFLAFFKEFSPRENNIQTVVGAVGASRCGAALTLRSLVNLPGDVPPCAGVLFLNDIALAYSEGKDSKELKHKVFEETLRVLSSVSAKDIIENSSSVKDLLPKIKSATYSTQVMAPARSVKPVAGSPAPASDPSPSKGSKPPSERSASAKTNHLPDKPAEDGAKEKKNGAKEKKSGPPEKSKETESQHKSSSGTSDKEGSRKGDKEKTSSGASKSTRAEVNKDRQKAHEEKKVREACDRIHYNPVLDKSINASIRQAIRLSNPRGKRLTSEKIREFQIFLKTYSEKGSPAQTLTCALGASGLSYNLTMQHMESLPDAQRHQCLGLLWFEDVVIGFGQGTNMKEMKDDLFKDALQSLREVTPGELLTQSTPKAERMALKGFTPLTSLNLTFTARQGKIFSCRIDNIMQKKAALEKARGKKETSSQDEETGTDAAAGAGGKPAAALAGEKKQEDVQNNGSGDGKGTDEDSSMELDSTTQQTASGTKKEKNDASSESRNEEAAVEKTGESSGDVEMKDESKRKESTKDGCSTSADVKVDEKKEENGSGTDKKAGKKVKAEEKDEKEVTMSPEEVQKELEATKRNMEKFASALKTLPPMADSRLTLIRGLDAADVTSTLYVAFVKDAKKTVQEYEGILCFDKVTLAHAFRDSSQVLTTILCTEALKTLTIMSVEKILEYSPRLPQKLTPQTESSELCTKWLSRKPQEKKKVVSIQDRMQLFGEAISKISSSGKQLVQDVDAVAEQNKVKLFLMFYVKDLDNISSALRCELFVEEMRKGIGKGPNEETCTVKAYEALQQLVRSADEGVAELHSKQRRLQTLDRLAPEFIRYRYKNYTEDETNNVQDLLEAGFYPVDFKPTVRKLVLTLSLPDPLSANAAATLRDSCRRCGMLLEFRLSNAGYIHKSRVYVQKVEVGYGSASSKDVAKQLAISNAVRFLHEKQNVVKEVESLASWVAVHCHTLGKLKERAASKKAAANKGEVPAENLDQFLSVTDEADRRFFLLALEDVLEEYINEIAVDDLYFSPDLPPALLAMLKEIAMQRNLRCLPISVKMEDGLREFFIVFRRKRSQEELTRILQLCNGKCGRLRLVHTQQAFSERAMDRAREQYFTDQEVIG